MALAPPFRAPPAVAASSSSLLLGSGRRPEKVLESVYQCAQLRRAAVTCLHPLRYGFGASVQVAPSATSGSALPPTHRAALVADSLPALSLACETARTASGGAAALGKIHCQIYSRNPKPSRSNLTQLQ